MLRESGPLMLNNLLATVFWRISQWVLYGARNPAALGIFSAGVKYLDGLNIIPAYFTLAIFPLMSRYAATGKDSLLKGYRLAVQLLYIVALPIAVFVSFAATPLIRILGGPAYLPGGATALSIMIWSIPIGFINSVTQYVLIAVNRQRFLTKAFLIGVAFTTVANLLLVPRYGYLAAAVIQIPAELSLFIPFYWAVRRYVAPMPWLKLLGGPSLAAGVNAAIVWLLGRAGVPLLLALTAGFLAYIGVLLLLGTFRDDDFAIIRARLPRWLGGHQVTDQS
jgi:O-antigen/teichoic acid export membrane protein